MHGLERLRIIKAVLRSADATFAICIRAVEAPVINGIRIAQGPPQSRARTRTTAAVVDGCPEAESVRHWAEKMVLPYIRGARRRSGCLRGPRNKTGATRDSTQAHSHPPPQSVYNDSCDKEEASGRLAASMPVVNKPDLSDMSRYVAVLRSLPEARM